VQPASQWPYVFPETQQADNFTPPATLVASGFNFGPSVLGKTTVSFASLELDAPPQYIEQWSASAEKSVGHQTTVEIGYLGAHGLHLQWAHLINNALPGPWPIGLRRPFKTLRYPELVPGRLHQAAPPLHRWVHFSSQHPCSRHSIPQNNNNVAAEKGPGCDVRHRFALSAVYDIPSVNGPRAIQHSPITGSCRPCIRPRLGFLLPFPCLATPLIPVRSLARTQSGPTTPASPSSVGHGRCGPVVQSDGFRHTHSFHIWESREEHDLRARNTDARHGLGTGIRIDRAMQVSVLCRVFQRTQSRESRHAKPLREYAAVRHHHGSYHARAADSAERAGLVLESLPFSLT
jgi:hypothetical protein